MAKASGFLLRQRGHSGLHREEYGEKNAGEPFRLNVSDGKREAMAGEEEDWISQAEAARIRGISRQAIFHLVENGRFRSRRVGGRRLVLRKDAVEYKNERRGRPRKGWK